MLRITSILLIICLTLTLTACAVEPQPIEEEPPVEMPKPPHIEQPEPPKEPNEPNDIPQEPFEWKIAIVSGNRAGMFEEYESAKEIQRKYGEDRVIHAEWPVNFTQEHEQMIRILEHSCNGIK